MSLLGYVLLLTAALCCTSAPAPDEKSCGHPGDIPFGSFQLTEGDSFVFGAIAEYSCNDGYHMVSKEQTRQCTASGWSNNPPRCEGSCLRPERREAEELIGVWENDTYPPGTISTSKCRPGYSRLGTFKRICLGGRWQDLGRHRQCRNSCLRPERRVAEELTGDWEQDSYPLGTIATYECRPGYTRHGTFKRICLEGRWQDLGRHDHCRRIGAQCGPPPVVQYGDTISFNKPLYISGESVEYKCPEYYTLKGNRTVRCLNGTWDEAPVCQEPCTAKEKDMEDNNVRLKWRLDRKIYLQHGDNIDFDCLSGYEAPPGTKMRTTCEEGKLEYPKCFKTAQTSG